MLATLERVSVGQGGEGEVRGCLGELVGSGACYGVLQVVLFAGRGVLPSLVLVGMNSVQDPFLTSSFLCNQAGGPIAEGHPHLRGEASVPAYGAAELGLDKGSFRVGRDLCPAGRCCWCPWN